MPYSLREEKMEQYTLWFFGLAVFALYLMIGFWALLLFIRRRWKHRSEESVRKWAIINQSAPRPQLLTTGRMLRRYLGIPAVALAVIGVLEMIEPHLVDREFGLILILTAAAAVAPILLWKTLSYALRNGDSGK
jgi:hypothetical protein